ncbi:hypothetical protein BH10ACT11_BH10ACT11_04660 [soil metagenome]
MSALVRRSLVLVALCALFAFVSSASAKTFVVTKKSDPNPGQCKSKDCSLREAVIAANDHNGKDTVSLPSKSGAYKLTREPPAESNENESKNGDLDLTGKTTVKHSGKGRATVDANGIDRAFDVQPGARSSFKKLVITGGKAVGPDPSMPRPAGARGPGSSMFPAEGGGIRNAATISVSSSVISKNRSLSFGGGIGVVGGAGLKLSGSTVTKNTAPGRDGGGIDADTGKVTIKRSKLTNNKSGGSGGAMYFNSQQTSTIEDSTISGNKASSLGGGLYLTNGQTFTALKVDGTTISGNRASSNGGGIFVSSNALSMTDSTVANNRAAGGGGGISVSASMRARAHRGGGEASARLNAVTVVGNKSGSASPVLQLLGGGLQNLGAPSAFVVANSLIALNFSGTARNDCAGQFASAGHNLRGVEPACNGFDGPGDLVKPNPKIGSLKSNGGPTKTIALQSGSPAIGKASKQSAPKRDQRGHKRDSKPDIGAFER